MADEPLDCQYSRRRQTRHGAYIRVWWLIEEGSLAMDHHNEMIFRIIAELGRTSSINIAWIGIRFWQFLVIDHT